MSTGMFFELNDDDRARITELSEIARGKIRQSGGSLAESPFLAEEKEVWKIYAEAHERAMKYYKTHLDKLLEVLKQEIKINAIFTAAMEDGEAEKDLRLEAFLKENLKKDTAPYLEMLKESRPQECDEVIAFIDYAFEHRTELYKEEREVIRRIRKTPKNLQFGRYLAPTPALSLMFNGKPITALGLARGKGDFDPATSVLKVKGVNMFTPESVQKVGVGAAKIFRYAVAEFTERNSNKITREKINPRIFLDVKDFATANGVDVNSESAMKNFRFKLKKSLETLRYSGISWTEKVKGKETIFSGMNYIGAYDLDGNTLKIEFTLKMAEYLVSLPLIQYPRSLYKLDDRDYNAFAIGEAMCIHYSQDNNVIKQTESKLRVESLLEYTSFPTYEELKKHRWSWERYVKELFENALDKLTQCSFIKNWKYCYSGGIEISDEEIRAGAIDSYEKFISLLVKFELNDYKEPKIRAIEIAKKKAENIEKLQKRHKTNKKADKD